MIRLALRPESRRPGPEPVHVSLRPVVLTGIAAWALALVVTLLLWAFDVAGPLPAATCVAGMLLGVLGLDWVRRRPGR